MGVVCAVAAASLISCNAAPSGASFAATTANSSSAFAAATIAPPTGFSATVTCHLTWTATASAWATGYKIERYRGGTLQQTFTINPATTTTYTDTGPALGTYTWKIWAYMSSWTSSTAQASAIVVLC